MYSGRAQFNPSKRAKKPLIDKDDEDKNIDI